jgi:hypothetical protein
VSKLFIHAFGNVACKFKMLCLVFTDRHILCAIEQHICRHEDRVIEEADADTVTGKFGRFVFELRHAAQFAEACKAV